MKSIPQSFHRRIAFWNVVFFALFALLIFVLLNVVSAGVMTSLITVGVLFLVFGSIHYIFWGRMMTAEVTKETGTVRPGDQARSNDAFSVELTDQERLELTQLLEQSTASQALANEQAMTGGDKQWDQKVARRRNLLERLRMYGA